jgi:putative selenate reductase
MSEEFSRISLKHLLSWILKEYDCDEQIFGIHKSLFFVPNANRPFSFHRFGQPLETPLGVAAGPHTQMAQNLISAWLCGSRYLELKTIQTLDELRVSKPCIDMEDEGYNCEWSQELRLDDSFDEYLNTWIVLHVLRHKFGWAEAKGPGFIFNMSVGYNMEGILKPNVQRFLNRMADCSSELATKIEEITSVYPAIRDITIPAKMSDNITLSTMHGCPPDEIEKIGLYLVNDRKYHTTIKLNPTLLGPDQLRHILNERLGFVTEVPDEAFGHDLKYPDALRLIKNLRQACRENNLQLSLKLTNTLESVNHKTIFPPNEKMMYMSGRALHPISINLAAKLQNEFSGELDISFSAGADCFNLPKIIAAGIKPVTVCSDILKPGGYGRLSQYLEELEKAMVAEKAGSINDFILKFGGARDFDVAKAALINLRRYAGTVPGLKEYARESKPSLNVKTTRSLPRFDCIQAPCMTTCPAHQDIPSYLFHTARGDYQKAFEVIMRTNPLPNICGMVCDHQCQHKCTRSNYDQPLLIREIKRFIAEQNPQRPEFVIAPANGKRVAIVGGGPSGLSCAFFLALSGFAVTLYESKAFAGGMVADAIPRFRLSETAIQKDIDLIKSLGVTFVTEHRISKEKLTEIRGKADYVYLAIGAQKAKRLGVPGDDAQGVLDFLSFLSDVKRTKSPEIGKRVAVIGGGNSAMDVARTAHRLVGPDGKVVLVYRRTRREMPADVEEIKALCDEGIEILELMAPEMVITDNGQVKALRCQRMRLGEKGADGRRRPEKIPGAVEDLPFDRIIPAIGQDVLLDGIEPDALQVDPVTGMTRLEQVFAGGDAVRGPATIIRAIADGKEAAEKILFRHQVTGGTAPLPPGKNLSAADFQRRSARKIVGIDLPESPVSQRSGFGEVVRTLTEDEARQEAERCLYCNDVCSVCVTVCPNRANRAFSVQPRDFSVQKGIRDGDTYRLEENGTFRITQTTQVINIGDFCNECGNCTTFCPTSGAPYKDKPKFYLTEASFAHEESGFFLNGNVLKGKFHGTTEIIENKDDYLWYQAPGVKALLNSASFRIEQVEISSEAPPEFSFERATHMAFLLTSLKNPCFMA